MVKDKNKQDTGQDENPETETVSTIAPDLSITDETDHIDIMAEVEELSETDQLRQENTQLKDRLMRALAEAENQRKRGERSRRDAELYGGAKLAKDMLSVYDNMSRALETIDDAQREMSKALIEGIELTQRELLSVFKAHAIEPVLPEIGDKFEPQLHEAMFEAPVPDVKPGHIIQVMSQGFRIGDRLLRAAQVGVSSGGQQNG